MDVTLHDVYLGDDILKVALFPRIRRVVHHRYDGVVVLLVFVVEEHQLGPQVGLVGRSQNLPSHRQHRLAELRFYGQQALSSLTNQITQLK